MILTKKFNYEPNTKEQIILGCFAFPSAKLWNIANYEKKNSKNNFSYLNNGFVIIDSNSIRFTLAKQLRIYLVDKYNINDTYLILKIPNFSKVEGLIKQKVCYRRKTKI